MQADQFTITNPEVPKKVTKAKFLGTQAYWERCVRRISIFTDTKLSPGYIVNGRIDLGSRFDVYMAFRGFMKPYEGINKPPFNLEQETEIRRVIKGGKVSTLPYV